MAIDMSEEERRKAVRRPTYRFSRGVRIRVRPQDRDRWRWQDRVWRTYGLAAHDVALAWNAQDGLCPICSGKLAEKRWVLDHQHVKGFRKLPPDEKRHYFRGVLCSYCNRYSVGGIERAGKERTLRAIEWLQWQELPSAQRAALQQKIATVRYLWS